MREDPVIRGETVLLSLCLPLSSHTHDIKEMSNFTNDFFSSYGLKAVAKSVAK
jgi:hypothetical protein